MCTELKLEDRGSSNSDLRSAGISTMALHISSGGTLFYSTGKILFPCLLFSASDYQCYT